MRAGESPGGYPSTPIPRLGGAVGLAESRLYKGRRSVTTTRHTWGRSSESPAMGRWRRPLGLGVGVPIWLLNGAEKPLIDGHLLDDSLLHRNAEPVLLEKVAQLISVNQVYWWRTVPGCFCFGRG